MHPCAQERHAPPPPAALRRAAARRGALPRRATSEPRARGREREGRPSVLQMGGGRTRRPDSLAAGRRAGERATPGLNSGIKGGAGKGGCGGGAALAREYLHAARRALSHRGGRVPALFRRFSGERGARSAGQPFKDGAVRLLPADGPRRPTPAGRKFRGSRSLPQASPSPAAAPGRFSETLLSPRHWDLVSSLEPLVNLRSGSRPPLGTTVPESFTKSLSLERSVLQECTPRKISTEGQSQSRASSGIRTPKGVPLSSCTPQPARHATAPSS